MWKRLGMKQFGTKANYELVGTRKVDKENIMCDGYNKANSERCAE